MSLLVHCKAVVCQYGDDKPTGGTAVVGGDVLAFANPMRFEFNEGDVLRLETVKDHRNGRDGADLLIVVDANCEGC